MKPIARRAAPPPIASDAAQRFSPAAIEDLQAFLVWQAQKLRARRHRDRRCVECGHARAPKSLGAETLRCKPCQAYRRERLRTMRVSVVLEES